MNAWRLSRVAAALGVLLIAAPASAQVVQSFQFGVGAFVPRGIDSRAEDDVLVTNLSAGEGALLFDPKEFRNVRVFGEWMVGFGNHLEVALGTGYYRDTVPSVYAVLENENDTEIRQDLRLRIIPVTGVVRFMPIGRPGEIQPYLGAGVSALNWRYSESGEFVDLSDFAIFRHTYAAKGTAVGPVLLGGVRVPIRGDIYGFTAEMRYQFGTGDLPIEEGFLSDRIDLSGAQFNFGVLVRF